MTPGVLCLPGAHRSSSGRCSCATQASADSGAPVSRSTRPRKGSVLPGRQYTSARSRPTCSSRPPGLAVLGMHSHQPAAAP